MNLPIIIVLHGWGHSSKQWMGTTQLLKKYEVIHFDLPGFGDEPLIDDSWGVEEYADWVNQKINHILSSRKEIKTNSRSIVLLGHSFGGRIAAFLASHNPEWLMGLVLYGAPVIRRPSRITKTKITLAKVVKQTLIMLGLLNVVKARIGLFRTNSELTDADTNGLGRIFRNVVEYDQTEQLRALSVPTLLLWGENDIEAPVEDTREIQSLITNSELIILPNLGHNAHLENSNLFYGTIKDFVESL